jgi:hypothetical protein
MWQAVETAVARARWEHSSHCSQKQLLQRSQHSDIYPYVQIQPRQDLAFIAGVDVLWRQNIHDSFFQPPGVPLMPGNANTKRFLGKALNLQAQWQATPNLDVNAAVVRFLAEGFLQAAGGHDITWKGLWATFNY